MLVGRPFPATMVEVLEQFWHAVAAGWFTIRGRDGRPLLFVPNTLQRRIFRAWYDQALRGRPLRVIGLKGRKQGFSTFVELFFIFCVCTYAGARAQLLAHAEPETDAIFDIARMAYTRFGGFPSPPPDPSGHEIRLPGQDSVYGARTGGAEYPLTGGNYNFLHVTELSKWRGTKEALARRMESVLQSLSSSPMSVGVIESTANPYDETAEYETRYRMAQAGKGDWAAVFSAWFEEPTYAEDGPPIEAYDHDEEEDRIRTEHKLSDAQLRWRRTKIDGDFKGSVWAFQVSYPNTWTEAFQSASGKVFPTLSIERHNWSPAVQGLDQSGWRFYRGVDWGGVDPFCCLWVAHHPNERGYSCDAQRCPNHWREMTHWTYGRNSKPVSRDDHAIDPLRYIVQGLVGASGRYHVFGELYEPFSAARGMADTDWFAQIVRREREWGIYGRVLGVADRSQPMSINLAARHGVHLSAFTPIEASTGNGEIMDGVLLLNSLIIDSHPLLPPPRPKSEIELALMQLTQRGPGSFADQSMLMRLSMLRHSEGGGRNPWFGRAG